jgi:hypothetical protein
MTREQVALAKRRAAITRHVPDIEHQLVLRIAREAVVDRIVLADEIGRLKVAISGLVGEIHEFAEDLIDKELDL